MRKWFMLLALCAFATTAFADEYLEEFPDPLGGWKDRFLGQYTNLANYYVCWGNPDENYRGNNPCGLWICDGNTGDTNSIINFDAGFGATITYFEIGIEAFSPCDLKVFDMDGALVLQFLGINNYGGGEYGCNTDPFGGDTPNGVSRFEITGSYVEGNTAIDNVRVVTGAPTAVESTSWGTIKALYR